MYTRPMLKQGNMPNPEDLHRQMLEGLKDMLNGLPKSSPRDIATELENYGYRGQEKQRQALGLMAYRHIRRLQRIVINGENRDSLPPKQNVLMLGPTGSGKTYLVELLFQEILKLPTVIVDVTSFTESGYIGDDVKTILTRLILASEGNPMIASCGIVCLDEFDKLASSSSNARFAGQGTTKDVSGYGVQRELLAMLQGAEVVVPMDYGVSEYGQRIRMSTKDIPFIACGAFAGYQDMLESEGGSLGFQESSEADTPNLEEAESFQKYGFLPELIGRFSRIVVFPPLPEETMKLILEKNILPQFKNEFKAEGLKLTISKDAMSHIIKQAHKRGTGARGLHTELVTAIESAAFESFMQVTDAEVRIAVKKGKLQSEVIK